VAFLTEATYQSLTISQCELLLLLHLLSFCVLLLCVPGRLFVSAGRAKLWWAEKAMSKRSNKHSQAAKEAANAKYHFYHQPAF
jgi:hypothetical protein